MRRREFLASASGAAILWPLAVRAEGERVRKVGVLMNGTPSLQVPRGDLEAFATALAGLGWTEGRNLHLEVRWGGETGSGGDRVINPLQRDCWAAAGIAI